MKEQSKIPSLKIDIPSALPTVGDKKTLVGSAMLVLVDMYDISFDPGDEIDWKLDLRRIAGGVEVTGAISGVIELSCYRCLDRFEFPISLKVREHALWLNEEDVDEDDAPASEYMVIDGVLDLEPIIRDVIALSFPASRVCDEACRGLCVKCGANLNVDDCGCETGHIDARLKPLEELKRRMETSGQ